MLCHLLLRLVSSVLLAAQLMWQIFHWAEDCGSARPEKYAGLLAAKWARMQYDTGHIPSASTFPSLASFPCVMLSFTKDAQSGTWRGERKLGNMAEEKFEFVLITIWHFKHYATVRYWNAGHVDLVHPLEFNSDSLAEKDKLSLATRWWFDLFKEWIIVWKSLIASL